MSTRAKTAISYVVKILYHCARSQLKKIFLFSFFSTVTLITTLTIMSQSTIYEFPVCSIASTSDDVIGYGTDSDLESKEHVKLLDNNDLCQHKSMWYERLPTQTQKTKLMDWSGKKSVVCPRYCLQKKLLYRRVKVELLCSGNNTQITSKYINSADEIHSVDFGDKCLADVIDTCAKGDKPVPNVVHYVWYGKQEFKFVHFLSFISTIRFMRPFLILIHGDSIPYGNYWNYLLQISPNIIHVKRPLIRSIYGNKLSYNEHGADVMRIEALQKYGGLYLDFDSVLLQDIDPLRTFDVTMGRENLNNLGNQFILAKKNATFLQLWHEGYKNYQKRSWGWNSLYVPYNIAQANPGLIHIESNRFTRPHWGFRYLIYNENYDWSDNYAMHLYTRDYRHRLDMDVIRTLNTTIGSVSRHVLFGNKELCKT